MYLESITGFTHTLLTPLPFSLLFQSRIISVAISCGDPGVPPNAIISGTHSWTYGSVLQYSCLPGGMLVGNSTRHCQEDGTWSGAPPYCTGRQTNWYLFEVGDFKAVNKHCFKYATLLKLMFWKCSSYTYIIYISWHCQQ